MKVILGKLLILLILVLTTNPSFCWGCFGHQRINYYAVFLLPPEMMVLFKPNIGFLGEHAIDPDKRRYVVADEGPRHYIDIDLYGAYPFESLPRKWSDAVAKFGFRLIKITEIVNYSIFVTG